MSIRIGVVAEPASERVALGAGGRRVAAMTWLSERDVDLVALDGGPGSAGRAAALRLTLRARGAAPAVTLLVGGSPAPPGPLVANASLATGAPTVIVRGAGRARGSVGAGPVLELGHGAASEVPCECAMVEVARADDGRLWVWREAGWLAARDVERARIFSATLEAWVFDGSRWRPGSVEPDSRPFAA